MNESDPSHAWKICYRELAPKLLLFARQWVADAADAEDVVQTAFVKFWRKLPDAPRGDWPLLYAAVRSTALDLRRGTERRVRREGDPAVEVLRSDASFFDRTVERKEDGAVLEAALRKLPMEQREVLVLRIWGELTFAQIAVTLEQSINTVSSRYRYALEALRHGLKPFIHERF